MAAPVVARSGTAPGDPVDEDPVAGPGRAVLLIGNGWPTDQRGGLNRFLANLHRALRADGVDSRALVVGPVGSVPDGVVVAGDARDPLGRRVVAGLRAARRLAPGTGLVDAHFALYAVGPVVVGALRRKPLVVHFQGPWADESAATGTTSRVTLTAKRRLERAVYRRADGVVVLSTAFKRILVERYRVSPWRIQVVAPGVDLEGFRPGSRRLAREALGLPDGAWIALTVRRLIPRTGVDVLIEAWSSVTEVLTAGDGLDPLLLVVGDGSSRPGLELQARAAGLGEGRLRFLGPVSDETLVTCYQAADLCVVPSTELEGFGLVVLEALACGTPVVATDCGGLPEALAGLDPSLVVPRGDPAALARRLVDAARERSSTPTEDACRQHAQRFTWAKVAERTAAVYRQAGSPAVRTRIRVVYLDHCARLSGGELALIRLLPALTDVDAHVILAEDGPLVPMLLARGISVEVLRMAEPARAFPKDLVRPGIGAGRAWRTLLHSVSYVGRLSWRLHRLRPDLVHTNSLKATVLGGLACRLAGVPAVFHIRDRIARDYLPPAAVRLVRAAVRRLPAAVIANSQTTMSTLTRTSLSRVIASPCTVLFDPVLDVIPRNRSAGPLRIGIVGRLAPWKGQTTFLEAFSRAFPDGPSRAVVVGAALFGEENYEAELHQLAVSLGIGDRVDFRGFRSDVGAEMADLDVLVHASLIPEPFGQVVLEGMAMALPVVATREGGPGELIQDGVDGVLYPMGDVNALADELRRLASDGERRARIGVAASKRARVFSPERVAAQVLDLYRHVLGEPRGSTMTEPA